MARREPDTPAVICPAGRELSGQPSYSQWTFRQLDEQSSGLARGLDRIGVRRGVRTVLMVKPSLEFFALTFALFKIGAVPVLVDPGMGIRNLGRCLAEAEPEAFIGIPKAHAARLVLGWARRSLRILVTVGRRWFWRGHTLRELSSAGQGQESYPVAPTAPDEMAGILFTSGATGPPKGASYTHGNFAAQVEVLRRTYAIQPGEIDLCTFPLFALFAPALGMTAVIPDMDATRPGQVEPRNIIEPIERFGVTNLFGSPALLHRVVAAPWTKDRKLPSLRRVISAGAPVPADVIERFTQMLAPAARLHTPYGATEALPVTSIGNDEILGETRRRTAAGGGVCVGRPVEGMRVAIIPIRDEAIPTWSDDLPLKPGELGEIAVQGPVVTREYFHRPEATALAKIADPARNSFWHRMGDVGYFDAKGRLWFCGRKAHRVITATGTLYTIPCEAVFNAHPQVFRTALVGVGPAGSARPVLCVELRPEHRNADRETLRGELLALGQTLPHTRAIQTFLFHPAFPVDIRHNSKIFREKLALWAAKQLR
jgi:acyl-CoA synthetase (AMP-forming)/AMP-acid ligase II